MDLPEIGELNRRVKILVREAKPDDRNRYSQTTVEKDEVWGKLAVVGSGMYFGTKQVNSEVTHRVYIRSYEGRTRPQDLYGVTELVIDGVLYRVKRVADAGGERRFTVMDVEEKGDAGKRASRPRISEY